MQIMAVENCAENKNSPFPDGKNTTPATTKPPTRHGTGRTAPRQGPNRTAARAIREGRTAHIDRPYCTGRRGAAARAPPHPGRGTRKPIRATAAAVSLVARQPPAASLHAGLAHRVDKQAASSLPTGNRTGNDRQRQDGQGRHMVTTRDRREYGRYSSAKM